MINVAIAGGQTGIREAFVRLINNFRCMMVTITAVDGIDFNWTRLHSRPDGGILSNYPVCNVHGFLA